jgi:hypothetical protein
MGGGCRESMWGEVETKIEVVGPLVEENEWEVGGFILSSEYRVDALNIAGP